MWTVFSMGLAVFLVGSPIDLGVRPRRRRERSSDCATNDALIDCGARHQVNQDGGAYGPI